MAKRKKYPRLPNAYGSIRYLGKNRTNPYAVHPPAEDTDDKGNYLRPKALCYVDDWYVGFAVLNAYHAGTYQPGDELRFKEYRSVSDTDLDLFCKRLLTDFSAHAFVETETKKDEKTFAEVYEEFYEWKYVHGSKQLSSQSKGGTRSAYKYCAFLHDKIYKNLRHADFQKAIDDCPRRSATKENIASLLKQMGDYAELYDITEKSYATKLSLPPADNEHGVPFSDDELQILWQHKDDPIVEFILIMCLSGFRIAAYRNIEINLEEQYFRGGVKTTSSKERTVPIHSSIQRLVHHHLELYSRLLPVTPGTFRIKMYAKLEDLGIEKHTPHDCRHTFSRLCEKYGVNENDRKRMLGHSFGGDITNAVYGHRTLDDLRTEIEKIQICDYLVSSKTE